MVDYEDLSDREKQAARVYYRLARKAAMDVENSMDAYLPLFDCQNSPWDEREEEIVDQISKRYGLTERELADAVYLSDQRYVEKFLAARQ